MTLDANSTLSRHVAVAVGSLVVAGLLYFAGYRVGQAIAAVPYILLFLVMIIGPIVVIWPAIRDRVSGNFPVNWRSELGIWFAIWAVIHVLYVFSRRDWDIIGYLADMSPWAFGALVAVILAFLLIFTSNKRALAYMGPKAWKWHQSHATYVIFWLAMVHIYDRAYLRPGFPSDDPLHWIYLLMFVIVVILHIGGFVKVVTYYNREGEYPPEIS